MSKQFSSAGNLVLVTSLAAAFSLITLWLIDSWIKYPLFLFEIFTIMVLYLIIGGYETRVETKCKFRLRFNWGLAVDAILISSSAALLALPLSFVNGGLIRTILALVCTSLIPGYALLNVSGLISYFTRLEGIILSYILSYVYTALLVLVLLPIDGSLRGTVILLSYIVLGLLSLLKHWRKPLTFKKGSLIKSADILALLLSIAFYALSFYFIYPGFVSLVTDVTRHYAYSLVLWRTPELYLAFPYFLAHLHESAFLTLSNSSLPVAQTTMVVLNVMLPLAFYVMTKTHLESIDARLPSLATLSWSLFTNSFGGFAWIYFLHLKLSSTGQAQLQLLSSTADKTYNGTLYGVFGLWYVPATVSFILLMAAIFLMGKREMEGKKYLAVFSVLVAALYLTHVTEAVVFILFLAILGFIVKNEKYRVDDALKSSIIGMIVVVIIYSALSRIHRPFALNASLLISLAAPIIASILVLVYRRGIQPKLPSLTKPFGVGGRRAAKTLVIALLFAYSIALLSWTMVLDSFHTWQVDTIGLVPWFMYPVMLGINGLLAIVALYLLAEDPKLYTAATLFFIIFMVFAFIAGKAVSIINLYFFDAGYWEKRFIWFIKIPLAILAPIPVIYVADKLRKGKMNVNVKTIATAAIIGVIVVYGISTTFLNLEYWNISANDPSKLPSQSEMEAVNALKKIFDNDPKAWLATVTGYSSAIATFATPADQLVLKQTLYTAYRPEMAFTQLYRHPAYDHAYVYLHNRDLAQLNKFADRFLANYAKTLPIVYENSEVKIYNVSKVSPPLPSGDTILLIPLDKSLCDQQTLYTAYSLLSQGLYNYTVAYDLDAKALNSKTIVLAYDPPKGNILTSLFEDTFNRTLTSYSIVRGNWRIADRELLGGETGKYGEGVILSPVFAENFTATFKAKPVSGNASVLNYVSLVYSWVDSKNYRIADIMFGADFYIYVHFRTIVNGIEKAIPNWPGIKTDLKWKFGDEYNITVTVDGTLNQIAVNGKTYLSNDMENIAGKIGLRYYRFYQVSFDYFLLKYNISLNLRPIEDYLAYLEAGGRLIILNTNGYHYFASNLFSVENSTLSAERIEFDKKTLNLPSKVALPKLTPRNSTTAVLSRYVGSGEAPFVTKQSFGSGELLYVNIKPIIEALRKDEAPAYYPSLGSLLEDLDLPKVKPNLVLSSDGYSKEIRLKNDVKVEAESLLFPPKTTLKHLEIKTTNRTITLLNVTSVKMEGYPKLLIKTENLTIGDGQGFYATLKLNTRFVIEPHNGMFNLEAAAGKTKYHITNVEQLSIVPDVVIQLLARTPKVSANEANFIEFYTHGSLNRRTRTYGQNLNVSGKTSFQIMLSDSYTMLEDVELSGSLKRDPPIVSLDELSTIPTAIFWFTILLPIFVGATLTLSTKRQEE
jgi:hypothetical protein